VAASPQPATWIAVADRAADNLAPPADADDALLRALLNRTATSSQTITTADQVAPQADDALAQAELTVGETLVIPATQVAADAIVATPSDTVEQQAVRYYVVRPGDTLSGIAQAY
jgi:LysM repeat protein